MEILAPAGGMDSLIAAVRCGADAVYLGLGTLNARRGARNFDARSLMEAARYCKERGVKIHLTLNTIVFDDEMDEVKECLRAACQAQVQALIVQDLAVWKMARECAPALRLHASTQMAVHDLQGVLELHEMGFSRVVLARELSLSKIQEICGLSPIEIEVFAHGALCMSMSGRCLFSAMAGGRSGNRGMCAQPCRLPMTAAGDQAGGRGGYALSLRELSLLEPQKLAALREAGVRSLKIEGRMKRPEYVAAAVTAARQALGGEIPQIDLLRKVFSRSGFTDGYFCGRDEGRSIPLRDGNMFGVRTKEDVAGAQDALSACAKLYEKETGRIALDFILRVRAGEPASLTVEDAEGCCVTVRGQTPQAAANRPATQDDFIKGLQKLGGTPFRPGRLVCESDAGLAFPVSAVNAMRREAVAELARQRGRLCPHAFSEPLSAARVSSGRKDACQAPRLRATLTRADQFSAELLRRCEITALYPRALARVLDQGADPARLAVREPPAHFGDAFSQELSGFRRRGVSRLLACGLSGIRAGRELGFTLLGDLGLNIANTRALGEYEKLGLEDCMVSAELSAGRIARLGGSLPRGIAAYGRLPLMVLRVCPVRSSLGCALCRQRGGVLTDRQGRRFPVSCEGGGGVSQLYNSDTLYLADKWDEMRGVDFGWLCFTSETGAQALKTLDCYERRSLPQKLLGDAPFTRGLYFRKVL